MPHRVVSTRALLLRSVDYRDADRIVTLLTEDCGKVAALARGARRSKRRFAGALEPCAVLRVALRPGRGDLDVLDEARIERSFPALLGDLRRISVAAVGLELARELSAPREPDERVFQMTVDWLTRLGVPEPRPSDDSMAELLFVYQLRMLALAGFAPQVDQCARTGQRASDRQAVLFDPRLGSVVSSAHGGGPIRLSSGARARVRAAIGSGWLETLVPWSDSERATVDRLLRAHLPYALGKELAGSAVLAQVAALPGRTP